MCNDEPKVLPEFFTGEIDLGDYQAYPKLYRPWSWGDREKYGLLIPASEVPEEFRLGVIQKVIGKNEIACVNARSNYKPEIEWPDVDEAVRELERLRARNIPEDRIFDGRTVRVNLAYYQYTRDFLGLMSHRGIDVGEACLLLKKVQVVF